jgi:hypothetical protein
MNNIIHAGGNIDNNHYSNSYEAIIDNIKKNINNNIIIEIDVLKIKDGYIIAHNGYENIYKYDGNFENITLKEFNNLKVYDKYTPMNFILLKNIVDRYNNVKFNLDIKDKKQNYNNALLYIKKIFKNNLHNLIPQIYELNDLFECIKLGFTICMVGMWKYYDDIYSKKSIKFIKNIQKYNNKINIMGFSIDFKHTNNFVNDKFNIIKYLIKSNIYLHCGDYIHAFDVVNKYNNDNLFFFL